MSASLVAAHIAAQQRLRERAAAAMTTAWRQLPSYNETDVPAFLARAVPITVTAQRSSVALTNAFLARRLGRQPVGIDTANIIAGVRNGADPAEVYRRPFVTVWTALKDGARYEDAVNTGLARASGAASMDVQLAMRGTMQAVQDADEAIYGFQRVADGGACAFCLEVNGAYVKSADAMPLHDHCGCGLDPLTAVHKRAVALPDGTRIRDYRGGPLINTPPPDTVAVHEHGELGPVLANPDHHFTAL